MTMTLSPHELDLIRGSLHGRILVLELGLGEGRYKGDEARKAAALRDDLKALLERVTNAIVA